MPVDHSAHYTTNKPNPDPRYIGIPIGIKVGIFRPVKY